MPCLDMPSGNGIGAFAVLGMGELLLGYAVPKSWIKKKEISYMLQ
jgi:hypothetical protein